MSLYFFFCPRILTFYVRILTFHGMIMTFYVIIIVSFSYVAEMGFHKNMYDANYANYFLASHKWGFLSYNLDLLCLNYDFSSHNSDVYLIIMIFMS